MNSEFPAAFASGGFRIAHAQKSLALYLKHLWCRGDLAMPPACPVDRLMLTHAKAPYGLRTWTSTNDVARYRLQLECLRTAANGKALAVWELVEFNRIAVFHVLTRAST